ncbi:multiple sugar ABC transporter, membrane-spanning permease protein MsmG [Lachnospiraceae bacterium KM106-2]|nr:multiple sugar ABC transporter, membrane-spanning permease protein MsmG [Lachnospiraceae bacterium KM106-2]
MEGRVNKAARKRNSIILTVFLIFLMLLFLAPIVIVLLNSFKGKFFISTNPFDIPKGEMFVGITNYSRGLELTNFFSAIGWSFFITVTSVILIVIFTSMTAWFITRVKSKITSMIYYLFVFSMIVPFQMVMYTMTDMSNKTHMNTPFGIQVLYLGFGAGLATFMFCGFVKSIPLEIEEAALIDGCSPVRTFFSIVLPILKPTVITVTILQTMWIWNDYLLPSLVLDSEKYRTIPIAVQYLRGGYGSVDMGAMMAMLVLAMLPIIIFYLFCQKYIIKGVVAGAVKG